MTAYHNNRPVLILDVFTCGTRRLAAIVAIDGSQPYVGGNTYPVRTRYATVDVSELSVVVGVPACDLCAAAIS